MYAILGTDRHLSLCLFLFHLECSEHKRCRDLCRRSFRLTNHYPLFTTIPVSNKKIAIFTFAYNNAKVPNASLGTDGATVSTQCRPSLCLSLSFNTKKITILLSKPRYRSRIYLCHLEYS